MITAGLLRIASQLFLFLMAGAVFFAFTQVQAQTFFLITAAVFFGIALFTGLKAKEQGIKAKVQIEEKERARIRAR